MAQDKWWLKQQAKKSAKKMSAKKLEYSRLAGKLIWCSAELFQEQMYGGRWMKRVVQGTYVRAIHGEIGTKRA